MGRGRKRRGKGGAPWNSNNNKAANGNGGKNDRTGDTGGVDAAMHGVGKQMTKNHYVQTIAQAGNLRMEAYYAAQGLHSSYWKKTSSGGGDDDDDDDRTEQQRLVPCTSVQEFNAERLTWRDYMGRTLPASFRFSKEVTTTLKLKMARQLVQLLQTALLQEEQEEEEQAAEAANKATEEAKANGSKEEEASKHNDDETETAALVVKEAAEIKTAEEEEQSKTADEDNAARRKRLQEPSLPLSVLMASSQPRQPKDGEENADADATSPRLLLHKLPFIEFAYQLNGLDRHAIRKHERLKALHAWIKEQQDCGHLTRQETVSMIPPVVLNVQSHHAVLDMCAAPGSKTSQLLETLGPSALLVANDANADRAFMLTHQLKRLLHNTFPITLVTACQAQFFPSSTRGCNNITTGTNNNNSAAVVSSSRCTTKDEITTPQLSQQQQSASRTLQLFDRILADVPCTGDGTTRKNIHVWKQWTQQAALSLHPLQLDIAWKGASQLLKTPADNNNAANADASTGDGAPHVVVEGGYMCYSTCSMNPIEDEAVVAELLRRAKGSLELVPISLSSSSSSSTNSSDSGSSSDKSNNISFRTRPGMSQWKVFCEVASKRAMRDLAKKNNAKMQQRRRCKQEQNDGNNATTTDKDDDETKTSKLGESDDKPSANIANVKDDDMDVDDKAPENDEFKTDKAAPVANASAAKGKDNGHHEILKEAAAAAALAPSVFEPASMDQADLIAMAEAAGLKYMPTLADVPEHLSQRVRPSCFPPTSEEAEKFHLERCMRCLPQDNDTGGFFVALLRKVGPISKQDYRRQGEEGEDADATDPDPKRFKLDPEQDDETKKHVVAVKEDEDDEDNDGQDNIEMVDVEGLDADNMPVTSKVSDRKKVDERFIGVEDTVLDPLIEYYGLTGSDFRKDLFMTRANGDSKVIYYLSVPVKYLLDRGIQDRVQVIASGLKAFSRNSTQHQCDVTHRIAQDAVYFVSHYMTKRKFVVDMHDFVHCLNVTSAKPVALTEGFSDKFAEAVRPIDVGAFVVVLDGYENKGIDKKMAITMWRCRGDKISLLVTKIEVESIKDKLQVIQEEQEDDEQTAKP
jgi:16S rRNA C967 or C1407 C5-methylase (RsmB/RsmF family)